MNLEGTSNCFFIPWQNKFITLANYINFHIIHSKLSYLQPHSMPLPHLALHHHNHIELHPYIVIERHAYPSITDNLLLGVYVSDDYIQKEGVLGFQMPMR